MSAKFAVGDTVKSCRGFVSRITSIDPDGSVVAHLIAYYINDHLEFLTTSAAMRWVRYNPRDIQKVQVGELFEFVLALNG